LSSDIPPLSLCYAAIQCIPYGHLPPNSKFPSQGKVCPLVSQRGCFSRLTRLIAPKALYSRRMSTQKDKHARKSPFFRYLSISVGGMASFKHHSEQSIGYYIQGHEGEHWNLKRLHPTSILNTIHRTTTQNYVLKEHSLQVPIQSSSWFRALSIPSWLSLSALQTISLQTVPNTTEIFFPPNSLNTTVCSPPVMQDGPAFPSALSTELMTTSTAALTTSDSAIRRKNFLCSICGKTFNRRPRAETCLFKHLGIKPYACNGTCGLIGW
jgi:hypothetical protein